VRTLDPDDRRGRDHVACGEPVEQLAQDREEPVGHHRAVERDLLDELDHVAATDVLYVAAAPGRQRQPIQQLLGLLRRRRASLAPSVERDEVGDPALDAVVARGDGGRHPRRAPRTGVNSVLQPSECSGCRLARGR
jgi:hypothetical protein